MISDISSAGRGRQREAGKEKFWRRALREFAAAGQSVRAFCAERGLSEPSFYVWRRTLAERDAATRAASTAAAAPALLPIRLVEMETAGPAPIEIVLGGGDCIRLHPPVDRSALIEIGSALRSSQLTSESAEA